MAYLISHDIEMQVLQEIKKISSNHVDISELEDSTVFVSINFIKICKSEFYDVPPDVLTEIVQYLKVICTKGPTFQNLIINTIGMLGLLKEIIDNPRQNHPADFDLKCFQLVANLCVNNEKSLDKIWKSMSEIILKKMIQVDDQRSNVAAMLAYNAVLKKSDNLDLGLSVMKACLYHIEQSPSVFPDFIQILLDYFLCESSYILEIYSRLDDANKKSLLFYMHDHIESEDSKIISKQLLLHITLEFKKQSDCILKTITTYVDSIKNPDLIVALLDVISTATPQEKYTNILKHDSALFLNLGCLLQSLHKMGKNPESIFAPIQKLDALTKKSTVSDEFEQQISYSIKTKLVKSLANLSYKNKKNQELARELEIMQSIFECTNSDARNPLIREWSILAIKNLCEDNFQNQEMVRNLTKLADTPNPILKELGLESGMLRIANDNNRQ